MANLSFIGDIGLNDDYINLQNSGINPFNRLSRYLSASDLVIGNLECTLKGNQGENLLKRPRISTTPEVLTFLKSINLGMVSLATNHIYDNLGNGFLNTIDFLDKEQIAYIGAGTNVENASKQITVTIKDISFCFLNYITADTNPSLPANATTAINIFNLDSCINDLRNAAEFDFRVVLMHWGGRFEGGLYPDHSQIALGRKLIDNGADLVIGHHSHTLQPYERYKNKFIFYSLGNFCFSDIYFEGKIRKMTSIRERESVIVNANFQKGGYTINLIPFRNEKLILYERRGVLTKLKLRNLCWQLLKIKPFWMLYKNWFMYIRPLIVQLMRKDPDKSLFNRMLGQISRRSGIKSVNRA